MRLPADFVFFPEKVGLFSGETKISSQKNDFGNIVLPPTNFGLKSFLGAVLGEKSGLGLPASAGFLPRTAPRMISTKFVGGRTIYYKIKENKGKLLGKGEKEG